MTEGDAFLFVWLTFVSVDGAGLMVCPRKVDGVDGGRVFGLVNEVDGESVWGFRSPGLVDNGTGAAAAQARFTDY